MLKKPEHIQLTSCCFVASTRHFMRKLVDSRLFNDTTRSSLSSWPRHRLRSPWQQGVRCHTKVSDSNTTRWAQRKQKSSNICSTYWTGFTLKTSWSIWITAALKVSPVTWRVFKVKATLWHHKASQLRVTTLYFTGLSFLNRLYVFPELH